jgi:hypothetical protein
VPVCSDGGSFEFPFQKGFKGTAKGIDGSAELFDLVRKVLETVKLGHTEASGRFVLALFAD